MVIDSMNMNSTVNLSMKRHHETFFRLILGALTLGLAASLSSCSTSSSAAWAKIQAEGLIPYLAEHHASDRPDSTQMLTVQEGWRATDAAVNGTSVDRYGVITAQAVEGKPGFVYSPHTAELLEVDVSDYQPGEWVLCPYTKKSFVVPGTPAPLLEGLPGETQIAAQPGRKVDVQLVDDSDPVVAAKATDATAKVAEPDAVAAKAEEAVAPVAPGAEIGPEPKPIQTAAGSGKIPSASELLALPKTEAAENIPLGRWVPGKPNYVYSPFAASNQVVDIEGHAPGSKVKCPYTGKIFAVPPRN